MQKEKSEELELLMNHGTVLAERKSFEKSCIFAANHLSVCVWTRRFLDASRARKSELECTAGRLKEKRTEA
eukprot:5560401-Amphidinium_carterae.2